MRHRNAGIKLGRTSSHRDAMFRNMVTSLFKHDRIRTTDVKAKELKRWADKIITLAKQGDLHSRRQALAVVREKDVVHRLFAEAADRFGSISGGYTRIVKAGNRPGDAAPVSIVELVAPEKSKKKDDKKKKPKASPKKKTASTKKTKGVKKEKDATESNQKTVASTEEKP
jgi:large subunit ribosomal protein L17